MPSISEHLKAARSTLSARLYRDRFHFEPLVLDPENYAGCEAGPLTFTVIDISNLIDHVGALNLLVATAPLLAHDNSATLHTEKLVRSDSTYSSLFDGLLCGHLPTVSMLLGLTPVDFVTNTSAISSGDELLLDAMIERSGANSSESGQLFARIAWKRPVCMYDGLTQRKAPERIHFDPTSLATILYHVYLKMFENEDVTQMMSNITTFKLPRPSSPSYQRASFVVFVSIVRTRISANWEKTVECLLSLIETNVSHLMTKNYIQELYVWLHLLDVYSVDTLRSPLNRLGGDVKTKDLRDWKDIPPVVCVTLKVPRERLAVFTDGDVTKRGTPPVHCLIQGCSAARPWQNIFGATQMGFGEVECHGTPFSASFEVGIIEDKSAWSGKSPLLVSFYAPTWMLLLQPRTASVEFGIQSTPQTTQAFINGLGLELIVYRTTLSNAEHVYISKNLPHQSGILSFCKSPAYNASPPTSIDLPANTTVTATVDSRTARVVSLAGRVDIISTDCKNALLSGGHVNSVSKTPFNFTVYLQPGFKFTVDFPIPVLESGLKIRIARKSSYIELICPVANGADWPSFRSFVYPTLLDSDIVTAWNVPYLKLDTLPFLDTRQQERLDWLTTHLSMMFSASERSLRSILSCRLP